MGAVAAQIPVSLPEDDDFYVFIVGDHGLKRSVVVATVVHWVLNGMELPGIIVLHRFTKCY